MTKLREKVEMEVEYAIGRWPKIFLGVGTNHGKIQVDVLCKYVLLMLNVALYTADSQEVYDTIAQLEREREAKEYA